MKKLILLFLLSAQISQAAFSQRNHRYMSGPQIILSLQALGINIEGCGQKYGGYVAFDDLISLGANNAGSGEPGSAKPNLVSKNWLGNCLARSFTSGLHKNIFMENFVKRIGVLQKESIDLDTSNWGGISPSSKKQFISELTENILGPDELIKDFGLIDSPEAFRQELFDKSEQLLQSDSGIKLKEVLKLVVLTLILRDEFLTY